MSSETDKKVIQAIHQVQQAVDIMKRSATADAFKFTYKYTPFPEMWVVLKPLLDKNGLTVIQTPVSGHEGQMGDFLRTEIHHESGEVKVYTTRLIITRDDPQGFGSAVTYSERYVIKTIFKIVTDDDNDATTQRHADGEMKKEWVQAYRVVAKKKDPEANPSPNQFIEFMSDVYGKHPSKVLAKEHQAVLDIIQAFDE